MAERPGASHLRPVNSIEGVPYPTADRSRIRDARPVRVAIIASNHPWRAEFGAFAIEHEARIDLHVVRDPVVVGAGGWDIVVIDDTVPFVDEVVAAVDGDASLVGITVPDGGGTGEVSLRAAGVVRVVPDGTGPQQLVQLLLEEARALGVEPTSPQRVELASRRQAPTGPKAGQRMAQPRPSRVSSLMTVGGPQSALALEAAIGLASALAGWDHTVLVDLDPRRPAAVRLGLQVQPNLRDLVSALARDGHADPLSFVGRRQISNIALPFSTMVGPSRSGTEPLLDDVEASSVLALLARHTPYQIATIGDLQGQSRAWVPAVDAAARLVAVTDPTPVGLAKLVEWMGVADRGCSSDLAFHVVFCGSVQPSRLTRLERELRSTVPPAILASVSSVSAPRSKVVEAQWQGTVPGRRVLRRYEKLLRRLVDRDSTTPASNQSQGSSAAAPAPAMELPVHPNPPLDWPPPAAEDLCLDLPPTGGDPSFLYGHFGGTVDGPVGGNPSPPEFFEAGGRR